MTAPLSPEAEDALTRLAVAIRGSPHNLVSRRSRDELESRHLPECVAFARVLPTVGPVLDLGSGGGLPGLVIAIVRPDLEVHLLEATGKKVTFLRGTARALGLAVRVHHGRAEDLATPPRREAYPVVTARAVAPLDRLAGWAAPYLAPGGRLFAIKGEGWRDEVHAAGAALTGLGLTVLGDPDRDPQLGPSRDEPHRPRVVMIGRST